jgi:hypothetical protein
MDYLSIITILFLVFVEISVLVYLYRNYITTWNAEKWEQKSREEGWISSMLEDVIVEVAEMVSTSVIERLKFEYTQAQGTLTRVSKSGETDELSMGLEVAESLLKSMGWKSPNVLLVAKLASSLKNMVGNVNTTEKAEPLPTGKGLFGTK